MSNDSLDSIIKKMNSLGKELSEKSNHYFKKAINKSEEYSSKGVQQLEIKKLRWKLNKAYSELGEYVYKNNIDDNVVDYLQDGNASHTATITLDGNYGTDLDLVQHAGSAQSYTLSQNCQTSGGCTISVTQQ